MNGVILENSVSLLVLNYGRGWGKEEFLRR